MWHWIAENGFPFIQTLGVAGGLFYAGRSFEWDRRTRETEIFISITEAHRDIWKNLVEHPKLARILDPHANLRTAPITVEEKRFVTLLYVHLSAVHQAIENGIYKSSPGMEEDIRHLIRLPIPASVLQEILPYQTPAFQAYLESLR